VATCVSDQHHFVLAILTSHSSLSFCYCRPMQEQYQHTLTLLHKQLQLCKRNVQLRGPKTHWAGVKALMEAGGKCSSDEVSTVLSTLQMVCRCNKSRKTLCERGNLEFMRSGDERQVLVCSKSQVTASMIADILAKLPPHVFEPSLPPLSSPMVGITNDTNGRK